MFFSQIFIALLLLIHRAMAFFTWLVSKYSKKSQQAFHWDKKYHKLVFLQFLSKKWAYLNALFLWFYPLSRMWSHVSTKCARWQQINCFISLKHHKNEIEIEIETNEKSSTFCTQTTIIFIFLNGSAKRQRTVMRK